MTILFSELKKKDILEVSTGKNLGRVCDLIISKRSGKIEKLIAPGKKCGFLSTENFEIPFCKIVKIGDDAILVDFSEKQDCCPDEKPPCNDQCFFDD
jgi:YlmC/YmxH family sporulation protein